MEMSDEILGNLQSGAPYYSVVNSLCILCIFIFLLLCKYITILLYYVTFGVFVSSRL